MKTIRFHISVYNALKINWCTIPSSKSLRDKIIEEINLKKVNYIVKYGLSTGVLTEKLIKRRNLKTIILLLENNKEFYFLLEAKFKEKGNLLIVYESVVNTEQYIRENDITYIHYVISCLPFASLQ